MNGTVIFGAIALFFIVSGLINFIGDLEDDVNVKSHYNSRESKNENYYGVDIVGEQTILLNGLSNSKKGEIWNTSPLKTEMMNLFPDFSLMHEFVENRMIDESDFKKNLLDKIDRTEEEYIGGVLTGQRAKATLSSY